MAIVTAAWTLEAFTVPAGAIPAAEVDEETAARWLAQEALDEGYSGPEPTERCYLVGAALRDPAGRVRLAGHIPPVLLEPPTAA